MANNVFDALAGKSGNNETMKNMAEMFGFTDNTPIQDIELERLVENRNHPFLVDDDKEMSLLVESIKKDGLIQPIIVRLMPNNLYEILAGHRRTRAHKILQKRSIKAIVIDVDDITANKILIDSNFRQRTTIYPSEVAKSYKLRYEDLKSSRNNENSDGRNLSDERKIDEILAEEFKVSKSSVYMYLHFNNLIEDLLELLDARVLKQKVADELSYLAVSEQELVYEIVFAGKERLIDKKGASLLRKESAKAELTREDIMRILEMKKDVKTGYRYFAKGQLEKYSIKFKSPEAMEQEILKFLETY